MSLTSVRTAVVNPCLTCPQVLGKKEAALGCLGGPTWGGVT